MSDDTLRPRGGGNGLLNSPGSVRDAASCEVEVLVAVFGGEKKSMVDEGCADYRDGVCGNGADDGPAGDGGAAGVEVCEDPGGDDRGFEISVDEEVGGQGGGGPARLDVDVVQAVAVVGDRVEVVELDCGCGAGGNETISELLPSEAGWRGR
jgi:hypothetical protein